jgi:3-phosphoshikimate 1-carboxyvinyltransferase
VTPLPDPLPIKPFTKPVRGEVALPGSKSLTNRALLLAALCDRPVTLTGALFSEDTRIMAEALRRLGIPVTENEPEKTIHIEGQKGKIPADHAELFVGNAGTAARFLTALCAAAPRGTYEIDGVPQMRKRPMKGLFDALRTQGAKITCTGEEGFFPITIKAHELKGGLVTIDASESSQMLSAMLMAAPLAFAPLTIQSNSGSQFVAMTMELMKQFGCDPQLASKKIIVGNGSYHLKSGKFRVDSDATAASYFIALPIVVGGEIEITDYRLTSPDNLQGDVMFSWILRQHELIEGLNPNQSTHYIRPGQKKVGVEENFNKFSDTFLTLAAIAPLLEGKTTITGIAHTRKQETDRVAGTARELKKLGQQVVETEDSLEITPNLDELRKRAAQGMIEIETYNDHRFAMSFAILGCHDLLKNGQPWLSIKNPGCCAKTFPDFFQELEILWKKSHFIIVAIDGGAASGKSSTARALAGRFNLLHVDTGSFYRAVTAELLQRGVSKTDLPAVRAALAQLHLGTRLEGRQAVMEINGRAAGDEIRGTAVNEAVSHFAAIPELRTALMAYQRGQAGVARSNGFRGLVMEGRDIGSVIFPDADFRFFLQADLAERKRRREDEGRVDKIQERDRLDLSRPTAPLACPPGAIAIDSTHLSLDEVVETAAKLIGEKLPPA